MKESKVVIDIPSIYKKYYKRIKKSFRKSLKEGIKLEFHRSFSNNYEFHCTFEKDLMIDSISVLFLPKSYKKDEIKKIRKNLNVNDKNVVICVPYKGKVPRIKVLLEKSTLR